MCAMGEPAAQIDYVDTLIVGGGPASLILSYILHGHVAAYQPDRPHFDPIINRALTALPSSTTHANQTLHPLSAIPLDAYNHLASSIRYSSQALPINTLLDTLVRPNADTDPDPISCVDWVRDASRAIDHLVVTEEATAGGQWVSSALHPTGDADERARSDDIGTLSYAEQLNLPGYSYGDFYQDTHGEAMGAFERPTKREIAEYLACYPGATAIDGTMMTHSRVAHVGRCDFRSSKLAFREDVQAEQGMTGFSAIIRTSLPGQPPFARQILCRHLVLASGTFTRPLLPPPTLAPLSQLNPYLSLSPERSPAPILIIGSGFSAADAIIASQVDQPVIHIFKWEPEDRPSPLKGCHYQAYPEYAGVYRRMKMAAINSIGSNKYIKVTSPLTTRKRERNPFEKMRNWDDLYEGLPNAEIIEVKSTSSPWDDDWRYTSNLHQHDSQAIIKVKLQSGDVIERRISGLRYVVGRRGTLDYLSSDLQAEVLRDIKIRNVSVPIKRAKLQHIQSKDHPGMKTAPSAQEPPADSQNDITGNTFRPRLISPDDGRCNLEVAPEIFVIGSLTGDSLIRHALGGCLWTACEILRRRSGNHHNSDEPLPNGRKCSKTPRFQHRKSTSQLNRWSRADRGLGIADAYVASLSGCPGFGEGDCATCDDTPEEADMCWNPRATTKDPHIPQHSDLHIDRRERYRRSREFLDDG